VVADISQELIAFVFEDPVPHCLSLTLEFEGITSQKTGILNCITVKT
jgi:hypothetical protein